MSVRRLAPDAVQPAQFAFTKENAAWANTVIAKYPMGRQASAVIPLLWRAQEQNDYWLPKVAIEAVAKMLEMAYIRVFEVATFYTMFNLGPVGKHFVQVCGTTPCRLRGAEKIIDICKAQIGEERHFSADGVFAWLEVECLGACCNAPMVQINNDFYEDLDEKNFTKLLKDMRAGKPVRIGSQIGRVSSEPVKGQKTLKDKGLYDGTAVGNWKSGFSDRVKKVDAAKKLAVKAAAKAAPAATPIVVAPVAPKQVSVVPKTSSKLDVFIDDGGPEKAPARLKTARKGGADDLKLIWGVGPKMEALLQSMGFFHFDQIAAWSDENLRYVDHRLEGFKGRARRDDWIGQAKKLATGWRPSKAGGDKLGK